MVRFDDVKIWNSRHSDGTEWKNFVLRTQDRRYCWAKKVLEDIKNLKRLIEYDYPIGNEIYADDNGIYFIVPLTFNENFKEIQAINRGQNLWQNRWKILWWTSASHCLCIKDGHLNIFWFKRCRTWGRKPHTTLIALLKGSNALRHI